MITFWITALTVLVFMLHGVISQIVHFKKLESIPIRILVNGSRGKSAVTRLIASACREYGLHVIARTTGAAARHILENGEEVDIWRVGLPRIHELFETVRLANARQAQVLVVECMALQPEYQRIIRDKYLKPNYGIVTNIRNDHLEIMGPTVEDSARHLCASLPVEGCWFTAETKLLPYIQQLASEQNSLLRSTQDQNLDAEELSALGIADFPQNFSLALAVCDELGIPRDVAWRGMRKTVNDPGALGAYRLHTMKGQILAVDAFSANDPDSTHLIMEKLLPQVSAQTIPCILVYNHRQDRVQRSLDFCPFIMQSLINYNIKRVILLGRGTRLMRRVLLMNGFPRSKLIAISHMTDGKNGTAIFIEGLELSLKYNPVVMIVGIGNKAGLASLCIEYWKKEGVSDA